MKIVITLTNSGTIIFDDNTRIREMLLFATMAIIHYHLVISIRPINTATNIPIPTLTSLTAKYTIDFINKQLMISSNWYGSFPIRIVSQ